jgi:hypothetical protein
MHGIKIYQCNKKNAPILFCEQLSYDKGGMDQNQKRIYHIENTLNDRQ